MGDRLRRALWRFRWPLAAGCLALAVALVVTAVRPPPPRTVAALVLTDGLPAGHAVAASDLAVARLPPAAVPAEALGAVTDAAGARLAVGLPAGAVLTAGMLVGPGLTGPPGTVVVPVPLADPGSVTLAQPGTRVDLLATPGDGLGTAGPAQVVAAGVLVLAVAADAGEDTLLASRDTGPATLYVAAKRADAPDLVGASAWTPLRAVLTTP